MTQKFTLLHKFFSDKDGKVVIWQTPNPPLVVWLVFAVLSHLLHAGRWRSSASAVSKGALITWAVLEIYSGASPFRRVLGTAVLIFSIASLL